MKDVAAALVRGGRVIDEMRGPAPGPTLILVGGVHGNEPAGVVAAHRVLARLRDSGHSLAGGEVVALAGNVRALAANRRYLERDLNRQWRAELVAAARDADDGEAVELAQLAAAIDGILARRRGPVFALDLHTTSADGFPFGVVGQTAAHREFAAAFPLPCIVGLEEQLDGVLTSYLGRLGCVTLAVEGGQSESAAALANHEAVVTIGLVASGLMPADLPGYEEAREQLSRARGELPLLIEVVARHEVRPEHGFRMEPGFANIQRTGAGTLLARDGGGEIRAPFDGLVLLPLYQAQGSDGFFYGRELSPGV